MTEFGYPFAAVVGQERVKKALLLNLIDPRIGGVLLCGEKGTAKSTVVRGLAALTRQRVVELPLNITEDMLVGSIDFEKAVRSGVRAFSGGLLERADGQILYVDEVNLLPDSIVSTLICAASAGENLVEREGVSYRHPCRFALVGTMNPEEGKLRAQFLDRFGLYVEVAGERDVDLRCEILRRRLAYEKDPAGFCRNWQAASDRLSERIGRAQTLLREIEPDDAVRRLAAEYALRAGCEGNRCELVLVRTAAASAAWEGRAYITKEDLAEAARFVLPHREREAQPPEPERRETPPAPERNEAPDPPDAQAPEEQTEQTPEGAEAENIDPADADRDPEDADAQADDGASPADDGASPADDGAAPEEELVQGEEVSLLSILPALPRDRLLRQGSGRRNKTKSGTDKGRYAAFTARPTPRQHDLALDATLRAAAPYQKWRDHTDCAVALTPGDLRFKVRESHVGATIVFVVDASGSMGAQKRMKATKEAILSMLLDSYQKRDRIGLVAFRKEGAETLLDITASVDLAEKRLQALPTGGRTPLAAGLYQAWLLLRARRRKDPEMLPMVVLVTDGRANRPLWTDDPVADALRAAELICRDNIRAMVIDTEKDFISLHIASQVAEAMHADYCKVDELRGDQLRTIVKSGTLLSELDGVGT